MNRLQVTARLKIHEGKLNEFKKVATQCLMVVKERDKNTRQYDWFFNEDYTECVVRELYVNSNAVFEHLANLSELFPQMLQTADLFLEVYGDPTPQLKEALSNMNIKYYTFYQGF